MENHLTTKRPSRIYVYFNNNVLTEFVIVDISTKMTFPISIGLAKKFKKTIATKSILLTKPDGKPPTYTIGCEERRQTIYTDYTTSESTFFNVCLIN